MYMKNMALTIKHSYTLKSYTKVHSTKPIGAKSGLLLLTLQTKHIQKLLYLMTTTLKNC